MYVTMYVCLYTCIYISLCICVTLKLNIPIIRRFSSVVYIIIIGLARKDDDLNSDQKSQKIT